MNKRTHQELDRRSLAMHRLIAAKIRARPDLFDIARDNVNRWMALSGEPIPLYLHEWNAILRKGIEHALAVASDASEDAARLRQSTPFAGVLESRERWEFLRTWNEKTSSI